ncbi:hypothetical protein K488DRAFT_42183 [Vararia minispora EC-137]|uniref:Uncharacterized protein n=1 Tax=Vararia minispora EC-137 TaxID=1314806 RepID=A0ACB8QVU8_9AGAM|nr:hypothetical protein K488DRAFT_42183 [Vararia minispora EC-137]
MSDLPHFQRAWRVVARGPPSKALRLESDLPIPTRIPPGNALVKVQAGGLNPVDYKLMKLLPNFAAGRPTIAAFEFSGVIVDGNGTEWQSGDNIVADLDPRRTFKTKQGALAEYVFVPEKNMVRRPERVTPIEASGVLLVGQTAWQALFHVGGLSEDGAGQTIFISGGSTAVGSFAIQFAKAKGYRVIATASGKNEQYVRDLGADEFIDYTTIDLRKYLVDNPLTTKYSLFLEAVGTLDNALLYLYSQKFLVPGGVFVDVGPQPKGVGEIPKLAKLVFGLIRPRWLGGVEQKFRVFSAEPKQDDMKAIFTLIAEEKVRPLVDSVFEFGDVVKAYERVMSQRATGKVIIKVDPTAD